MDTNIHFVSLHLHMNFAVNVCHFHSERFANLLSSGELLEKASVRVTSPDLEFGHALQKICFYLKFSGGSWLGVPL